MTKYSDLPEKSKKRMLEYQKENVKRIPLNVNIEQYHTIKAAAARDKIPVNTFIKKCIFEKIGREDLL